MPLIPIYLCMCDRRWQHVARRLLGRCRFRFNETVAIEPVERSGHAVPSDWPDESGPTIWERP